MKTTFRFFLLFAALTGFVLTGCEPVEGDTGEDDLRDPFVGAWQFVESFKSTEGQSYVVIISKDPNNSSQVKLVNFGNPGSSQIDVTATVTTNSIVVAPQTLENGWLVKGEGKITNVAKTTMTWTYTITAGGDDEPHSATATKQ
jgi:hypothetical protein